ncbi:unnamed protein product [Closterium sp. NIES-54]
MADGGGLNQLLVTPYGDSEAKDAKARDVGFGCGGNFDHVVVVAKDVAKGVSGGVVTGILVHGLPRLPCLLLARSVVLLPRQRRPRHWRSCAVLGKCCPVHFVQCGAGGIVAESVFRRRCSHVNA